MVRSSSSTAFIRTAAVTISNRRRRYLLVGAAIIALSLAGAVCNPDPTSGGFALNFLNDTPGAVIITYCSNSRCSQTDFAERVQPKRKLPVNTSAQGFDEWYKFVVADTGKVIGCKTLNFHKRERNVVILVSSATPCLR